LSIVREYYSNALLPWSFEVKDLLQNLKTLAKRFRQFAPVLASAAMDAESTA
jgi:hypothetical protein